MISAISRIYILLLYNLSQFLPLLYMLSLSRSKLLFSALLIFCVTGLISMVRHEDAPHGVLTAVAAGDQGYEMFLKLDTIPGDSTDQKHKAEIVIDSFAWGESRTPGATRPAMEGMVITLPANRTSPRLFLYTAGGLKIGRAVLSVRKSGASTDMLRWILTDSQIVNFKTVGNIHGDGVNDQITLAPGKIEFEYIPADGSKTIKAGWDQRSGKSVSY